MPREEFLTLAPGSDRIPVELFQILKDDAVESAALNMQYAFNMQYAGSRHFTTEQQQQGSLADSDARYGLRTSGVDYRCELFCRVKGDA